MKSNLDWRLLTPLLIIIALSLATLGSISPTLFFSQTGFLILGAILFIFFSRFSYQNHHYLFNIYFVGSIIFLLLPLIFGVVTRGAVRWIQIGNLTIQPSELVKPFLIIIFASFLTAAHQLKSLRTFLSYLLLLLLPAVLIFNQPDLGSTLVLGFFWLIIFLASDLPLKFLSFFSLSSVFVSPFIWKLLRNYQKQRLITFFNPFKDPRGTGYQVIQSVIAVGSGGIKGRGLGSGSQSQLQFLPERHTDFIFASLSESLGLAGSLVLLVAFYFLLKRLLEIASNAPDLFSRLIVIGVFAMIFFQAIVNIGMNLGMLPVTGITLPLVSAGGSSILATSISLGLVHHISTSYHSKKVLEIK